MMGPVRIILRCLALVVTIYGMLVVFWLARMVEFPWGRPFSPGITRMVCHASLRILGTSLVVNGKPMSQYGAVVANHVSWLDIFALNAPQDIFFVAKSEVRTWFGIGILANSTGTVFIERDPGKVKEQQSLFMKRLARGDRLLFFPEGTSTDGLQVLPFKSSLFAPFMTADLKDRICIQPVTIHYRAPPGEDPRFYAWWGSIEMGPHLLRVLAARSGGQVNVTFHQAVQASSYDNRKALARHCEQVVRSAMV